MIGLFGLLFIIASINFIIEGNYGTAAVGFIFGLFLFYGALPHQKKTRKKKKKAPIRITHTLVDDMTGEEYERYCGERLLKTKDVKRISYTPTSNDYGADIIAYMRNGEKVVIQCKRYNGSVGNSAVQEVVAAISHYNADSAMIITNSILTGNAKRLAKENRVECWELFK